MKNIDLNHNTSPIERVVEIDSTSSFRRDTFIKKQTQSTCRLYTATELLEMEIEEVPMLWDTYLQQVGVACLTGPSDSGKSTLTKQLAERLATNSAELLDKQLHPKSGNVLFIITEDTVEAVAAVIHHQMKGEDKTKYESIEFFWMEDPGTVQKELVTILNKKHYDLVVVDVWMDIFNGSPNNLADVRSDLWSYQKIAVDYKCLFLFIHHNSKAGSNQEPHKNGVNGSQGIEAKMRAVLDLRNIKDDLFTLTIVKSNYCPNELKNKPYGLRLDKKRRLFEKSDEAVQMAKCANGRATYTDEKMHIRILELRQQGKPYDQIPQILSAEFIGKKIPSPSWMKTYVRKVADPDGMSDIETDETGD